MLHLGVTPSSAWLLGNGDVLVVIRDGRADTSATCKQGKFHTHAGSGGTSLSGCNCWEATDCLVGGNSLCIMATVLQERHDRQIHYDQCSLKHQHALLLEFILL